MRIQPNKEAALDFVGRHSWQEKEAMGIHNYIRMLTDLWPPGEPMVITRLQQPDGSHITMIEREKDHCVSWMHIFVYIYYDTLYIS